MTAAEIIELLRTHPQACRMLGIVLSEFIYWGYKPDYLYENTPDRLAYEFRHRLTGACVEKCDELGIVVDQESTEFRMWYWFSERTLRSDPHAYDTRLHAMLAGLEAHGKESTND